MNYDSYVYEDFLVWTMTTNGYKYITYNLYESLKRAKVSWKLMIICVDRESYTFLQSMNVPRVYYKPSSSIIVATQPSQFGSETFMSFNKIKLDLMEKIRKEVPESVKYITYMDGDIVVFKDFMPYIKEEFAKTDSILLFQNDDLYNVPNTRANGCTGFFSFKVQLLEKSPFYIDNLTQWKTIREDQVWVNNKLVELNIPFSYLNRGLFPNGTYLKDERWKQTEPYLIHYNHFVGNSKISMMKKNKHWYIIY
jgi:hypothetical protein